MLRMNANELLDRLAEYPDDRKHVLRKSPVLEGFPADPAIYLAIAREVYATADFDWEIRQRVVGILREFLYRDGRSFEALMYVAERSYGVPDEFQGINALAGISCYLRCGGEAPLTDEELVAKFNEWMQDDNLRNNAANCRNLILARRPDLAD
jgi:hypothetical protein